MCDLGSDNGRNITRIINGRAVTGVFCDASCKLPQSTSTNPGANPIQFMINIPGFAKLGHGMNAGLGKKAFHENGMIVGQNTPIFALSDVVELEMQPLFSTPIQIEANRIFTISQEKLQGNDVQAGINMNNLPYWEVSGNKYYVLGSGDFIIDKNASHSHTIRCAAPGAQYKVCAVTSTHSLPLFHGKDLQAIKGGNTVQEGAVHLAIKQLTGNDTIRLASFPVEVVSGRVSSLSSPVNRKIKQFTTDFKSNVTGFLTGLKGNTSLVTNTDNNAGSFPFGTNTINPINANIRSTGNVTVNSASDLTKYIHNGNQNVYAVKGDLTLSGDIEMTGVKTVLVEGNIHIKKNIFYKSGDNNASWAFIAKGGNIIVDKNVTNLAGVFLAIPENGNGGKFTQTEATATILRIDGTLYGDAKELFEKRTYARASNAYDILTTGTVLNYSNRALRNPPPLLSNYLNNYKVQRVVR